MRTLLILLFIAVVTAFVLVARQNGLQPAAPANAVVPASPIQPVGPSEIAYANATSRVAQLDGDMLELSNALEHAQSELAAERATTQPLRDKLRAMSAQEITYVSLATERAEQVNRMQKRMRKAADDFEEIHQRQEAEYAAKVKQLEADLAEAKAAASEIQAQHETLVAEKAKETSLANEVVDKLRQENSRLRTALAQAEDAVARAQEQIKKLGEARVRLEQELRKPTAPAADAATVPSTESPQQNASEQKEAKP